MKAVLPGRPEARLQAVATGSWQGRRTIIYATGNALAILSDPDTIHQTIYDEDERNLEAVAFDEKSGKIAASTGATVRIYHPIDFDEDTLKVGALVRSWMLKFYWSSAADTPCRRLVGSSSFL